MADPPVPPPAPANLAPNQPAAPTPADPNVPASNQPVPAIPVQNQPALIAPQIIHQQILNWSHFKPKFAGRSEEDVEAHLLCTNNWMPTHNFLDDVKVHRFCLTLVGETGLGHESLTSIANNWPALQENFRKQYSKIGSTREQLFHAWRSFHYDENTKTVDAYVNRIRQVAAMLGYEEPQILEVFKNTIPNRLYWNLFPIDNLRMAFEMAKRVLTKEKIDRQMSGQSSATPFMKVNSEHYYSSMKSCKKGVTFDVM